MKFQFLLLQKTFFTSLQRIFMKLIPVIILWLLVNCLQAQKPEKIERRTIIEMPNEYYISQAKLWKKILEKEPKNADAWYNYYKASRYMHIEKGEDSVFSISKYERLMAIEKEVEQQIPNTFEANIIKWWNGGNNPKFFPYLEKAAQIDPERVEIYDCFIAYYELQGNTEKRDVFLKKWYDSGLFSTGYLNYNYNVLMSLKPNAILITNGDNDSYPVWVLQAVKGIRTDVQLVNYYMLYDKDYRERFCKMNGIKLSDPIESEEKEKEYRQSFIKNLAANTKNRPVYTGNTCNPGISESVEKDMYLVGLAYLYSPEKFDNVAVLKKNLEKNFALDYLKVSFSKDIAQASVNVANMNYIVPILSLYDHYFLAEEKEKANEWKNLAIQIAKGTEMEAKVSDYFKEK